MFFMFFYVIFTYKVKILVTVITEPIEFSILAKLYIGYGMS